MDSENFNNKMKLYLKIIFLGFFVNAVPYFISDFWIKTLHLENGFRKTLLVLISWIFVSGTVFMFGEDLKNFFENKNIHTGRSIFWCVFLSITFFALLAHNIN